MGGAPDRIGCAIVGYGSATEFGRAHAGWIRAVPSLRLVAVCDRDPARAEAACRDLPGVDVYSSLTEMLALDEVQLVSVVVPHNAHAAVVLQCLDAGKHVLVDKPMAVTVAECDTMIAAARRAGRTLAVFHNRRHDGNYRAITEAVRSGAIGDVFRLEVTTGGYGAPGGGWRAQAAVSGGALYDWGAHAVDWVHALVRSRAVSVLGFSQKRLWHGTDLEDDVRATIRYQNGAVADVCLSYMAAAPKPLWYILGTHGAIVDTGEGSLAGYAPEFRPVGPSAGSFRLIRAADGRCVEERVPYLPSDWVTYYQDMARHLREGAPVPVSATEGRRVIAVLEAARRSAQTGQLERLPEEW